MLDLAAVRSLIAVRDHGTVVGAADALGFTPSAVSQQIKRLERQSGCSMLEHVGRGVILSERGRMLAEHGQRLLGELEELENVALSDARRPTGEFRIASFYTAGRGVVAPLIARLAQTAPDLQVLLHEIDPRECLAVVERGGADLGIVHDWETVPLAFARALEAVPLFTDTADVLLPIGHPLAQADAVDAAELVHERWVSMHAGTICDDWLTQMFAMHGARPNVPFRDGNFGTHVGMVEQGIAVALLPRLGRERLPDTVRAVPVRNPTPHRQIYSVWRRASVDNPERRHVQQQLESVVAGGGFGASSARSSSGTTGSLASAAGRPAGRPAR
ncbi:MAG: LysR family transcriptional regulator [Acidobacteriota bacterium]|nr:LysR family transcriptional regulator [Acidobacteriota bacterium]